MTKKQRDEIMKIIGILEAMQLMALQDNRDYDSELLGDMQERLAKIVGESK